MHTSDHQLNESQLNAFLHKKGASASIASYFRGLPDQIDTPVRSILDCGGGNGMYLDTLLEQFPEAEGTLVDSAQFMLDQNAPHPRKRLVLENLENLPSLGNGGERFDLICFFDVLHHCVTGTYKETRVLQAKILKNAAELLSPLGRILVGERIMESWVCDGFSTRWVYSLTKSKLLAPLTRMAGANTGGTGVAFMSKRQLLDLAHSAHLCQDGGGGAKWEAVLETQGTTFFMKTLVWCSFLGVKSISNTVFRFIHKGNAFQKQ